MAQRFIIIGISAAGLAVANKLRQLDPEGEIVCISDEQELPYNKCFLADYLAGLKTEQQTFTSNVSLLVQKNIKTVFGTKIVSIDSIEKRVIDALNNSFAYDKLFIGTGSSPYIPDLPGIGQFDGVFTFHNLADTNRLLHYSVRHQVKRALVIGAGLSGLECADALAAQGIAVTIIECGDQLLPRHVDVHGSQFITLAMARNKVQFYGQQEVTALVGSADQVTGATLASGEILPAHMVIVATGLRPNSQLAQTCGIAMKGIHIKVNDFLQTSIPDIYAGGDVIVIKDQITGNLVPSCTWPDAMLQGMTAAYAMAGNPRAYQGLVPLVSSSFFGLKFASLGLVNQTADCEIIIDKSDHYYHRFILENNLLRGFLLIGATHNLPHYRRALLTRQQVTRQQVLSGAF